MKNPNEHEFGHERVKTAQQRVITYSGRGWDGVSVLAPSPLRAPPVILAYHMDFGPPPKLCALWDKIPQNFWVGGMPHGYSRGSWCALRVPEKTMFGRTNNVGFDPFSSQRLVLKLAPVCRGGRATWLILPVVICLSQRLSHACASMN
uniref:Uncharacterized protein n=1 Tax=Setaria italica TaxID=4555 RepID=K3YD22_SETIT